MNALIIRSMLIGVFLSLSACATYRPGYYASYPVSGYYSAGGYPYYYGRAPGYYGYGSRYFGYYDDKLRHHDHDDDHRHWGNDHRRGDGDRHRGDDDRHHRGGHGRDDRVDSRSNNWRTHENPYAGRRDPQSSHLFRKEPYAQSNSGDRGYGRRGRMTADAGRQ